MDPGAGECILVGMEMGGGEECKGEARAHDLSMVGTGICRRTEVVASEVLA